MELKFKRESFATALQIVAGVVPSRTPKDILKNVKLSVEQNSATLSGNDMETGIRCGISDVETGSSGQLLLPTSRLQMIVRELNSDEIDILVNDHQVEIKSGQSEFRLPIEDPADFPDVPTFKGDSHLTVNGHDLRQAIKRTIFASDDESARYALGGICLEFSEGKLTLAATDSRRLAVTELPATPHNLSEDQFSLVVPKKAMLLLERSIDSDESEIQIAPGGNEILFQCGPTTIYSRLVEGRFPNYRDVLPSESTSQVQLVASPFYHAVRQAQIVTNDESRGVDFAFEEGLLTLKSKAADVGQSTIQLPIDYAGAEVAIMFDPRFVADFLRVMEPEAQIELGLTGSEDPALFQHGDGYRYVVMPLARDQI